MFERIAPQEPSSAEASYSQMVPLGRIDRPEEAADAALWLFSDVASYVTGLSLVVDGGMTAPFR